MRLRKGQMEQLSERMAYGRWNDWEWENNCYEGRDLWEEQNDHSATLCVFMNVSEVGVGCPISV